MNKLYLYSFLGALSLAACSAQQERRIDRVGANAESMAGQVADDGHELVEDSKPKPDGESIKKSESWWSSKKSWWSSTPAEGEQ